MSNRFVKLSLLLLLFLTACGKEGLYQDLSERDANEILVVLYQNGIEASKVRVEKAQEVSYIIKVPKKEIFNARRILVDNNLPKRRELGFSGICKEKGLIPTPEEEKCRKLLALKGEIINSLQEVPGVINADVVLNIPETSEFSGDEGGEKKPTASAVIRVKKDLAGGEISESRMQRFIANTVENLDPRDVSVIISFVASPQEILAQGPQTSSAPDTQEGESTAQVGETSDSATVALAGLQLSENSAKKFKFYAIAILLVLIGVSAALIYNVIKLTRVRQEFKVFRAKNNGSENGTPLLEEGKAGESAQLQSGDEKPDVDKENTPK